MQIVGIRSDTGSSSLGVVRGDDVVAISEMAFGAGRSAPFLATMATFLEAGEEAVAFIQRLLGESRDDVPGRPLRSVDLGPPVPRPGKIIAVGLNYKEHVGEANFDLPSDPLLFAKFSTSIAGPTDEIVVADYAMQVDSEAEVAVVIGRRGKGISEEGAYDYIAGYMALNDVSARSWQFADKQWTRGKSCDTFCPTGPWLTTRDEIIDPHNLRIVGRLNNEVMQDASTQQLIFRIPKLLAYISATITLEPGDLIATGTPSGVGAFRSPPVFMRDGDVAEVEIEKLGVLRNRVRVLS